MMEYMLTSPLPELPPDGDITLLYIDSVGHRRTRRFRREGDIVRVELTKGYWATIDIDDYPIVAVHIWHASRGSRGGGWYAVTNIRKKDTSLHRFLVKARPDQEVDHQDRDTLNFRRSNLRVTTRMENSWNGARHRDNRSGFKGVRFHDNRWDARIMRNGQTHYLGRFRTAEEAARAYDAAARELSGQFARLNFPNDGEQAA